jgi:hypothetical protein
MDELVFWPFSASSSNGLLSPESASSAKLVRCRFGNHPTRGIDHDTIAFARGLDRDVALADIGKYALRGAFQRRAIARATRNLDRNHGIRR